jgi:hypothetical protein
MRRMEIGHDQTGSEACTCKPRLAARLRAGSLQRLWVLPHPWAVAAQVLLHAPGWRSSASDEVFHLTLSSGLCEARKMQRADGAELPIGFHEIAVVVGSMPAGRKNCVEIAIVAIPALLAMNGHTIEGHHKQKRALRYLLLRDKLFWWAGLDR